MGMMNHNISMRFVQLLFLFHFDKEQLNSAHIEHCLDQIIAKKAIKTDIHDGKSYYE